MRPRVYVTQPVAQSAIERLRAVADVELNPDSVHIVTKDELLAAVRGHDILFCLLHDKVDRDVIAANPNLRHDRVDENHAVRHRCSRGDCPAHSR